MILFVRHGERADMVANPYERKKVLLKFDPPLTEKGEYQAKVTGQKLRLQIEEFAKQKQIKIEDLKISFMSSPFLRCIQTAVIMMNELPNNSNLFIQNEIGELMYTHSFDQNILMQLHFNTFQHPILNNNYLNGIQIKKDKFINANLPQPIYPEDQDYCQKRVGLFLEQLFIEIKKQPNQQNTIFICITHQGIVSLTLKIQKVKNPSYVDYCGLSQFFLDQNGVIQNGIKGQSIWQ
ncbi:unnamed protein product [Paramecium sonneborni]|uniref:Phosphoglycerate mutase n=1 Tax=Paramecium sonneborni TaxID=65129 RepID=A0A8S1PR83_9CILI|nr:unnamed protein product [Paramecium sonneborni]